MFFVQTVFNVEGDTLVENVSGPFTTRIVRSVDGGQMAMVSGV